MSGRNPPSYCTLTLIAMQGHQQKGRQTNTSSNNKDKSDTIIDTSTAEDHDVVVVVVSHVKRIGGQPEKTTLPWVANPARGLLHNRENRTKENV